MGAAVAFQAAKVESRDAMLTESAFEGEATIQWFCCVMSHGFLLGNESTVPCFAENCRSIKDSTRLVTVDSIALAVPQVERDLPGTIIKR